MTNLGSYIKKKNAKNRIFKSDFAEKVYNIVIKDTPKYIFILHHGIAWGNDFTNPNNKLEYSNYGYGQLQTWFSRSGVKISETEFLEDFFIMKNINYKRKYNNSYETGIEAYKDMTYYLYYSEPTPPKKEPVELKKW